MEPDPNACPHCHSYDCVYPAADCPVLMREWELEMTEGTHRNETPLTTAHNTGETPVQEQEERDYWPDTELRNAFAQSQQEFSDDRAQVEELRRLGRWVLVATGPAFCPSTDAIIGERVSLIGDYATPDEAESEAASRRTDGEEWEECRLEVRQPILPQQPPQPIPDNEIPF